MNTGSSIYSAAAREKSRKRYLFLLLAVSAVLLFAVPGKRALWDPGEGRYGEISREMAESGDYLVPRLNYVRYFEKPPLMYWLNAFAMKTFGAGEFGARFFTSLFGWLSLLGTFILALLLFPGGAEVSAFAVLLSSIGFFAYTQIPELDMALTFFVLAGLGLFYAGFEKRIKSPAAAARAAYFFLGLGTLVKGPVAFVLPGIVVFLYLTITWQWRRWRELRLFSGLLIFLAVTAPWFWAVSKRETEFFNFFFIREHFQRYTTTVHGRKGSSLYFLPVLLLGMAPWSMFLLPAFRHFCSKGKGFLLSEAGKPVVYLSLWSAAIFLFFSVSSSKRPPYLLLIFPPLAVLLGAYFDEMKSGGPGKIFRPLLAAGIVNAVMAAAIITVPKYIKDLGPEFSLAWHFPVAVLLLCDAALVFHYRRRSLKLIFADLAVFTLLFNLSLYLQVRNWDAALSRKDIAGQIMREYREGDLIISYNADYERNCQSLNFYTGKRIAVVGSPGELEFGSRLDSRSDYWFPSEERFFGWFASGERLFVVAKKKDLKGLADRAKRRIYLAGLLPGKLALVSNKPFIKD